MKDHTLKIKVIEYSTDGEPTERVEVFDNLDDYKRAKDRHMKERGHCSETTWTILRKYPYAQGTLYEKDKRARQQP